MGHISLACTPEGVQGKYLVQHVHVKGSYVLLNPIHHKLYCSYGCYSHGSIVEVWEVGYMCFYTL